MNYQVHVSPRAEADLEEAYTWAARHAPETAAAWYDRFRDALQTLSYEPTRCGLVDESPKLRRPMREFHYGTKPNVFRVIFEIVDNEVIVYRIWRASRRALRLSDL